MGRQRDQQRVAVRGRLGDKIGADHRICAGFVFHQHGLLPGLLQPRCQQARNGICRSPGRVGQNQTHRFARVGSLRTGGQGEQDQGNDAAGLD